MTALETKKISTIERFNCMIYHRNEREEKKGRKKKTKRTNKFLQGIRIERGRKTKLQIENEKKEVLKLIEHAKILVF